MRSTASTAAALMDDSSRYPAALFCSVCPLRQECGGLHCKASPLACDEFCCGHPNGCTTVCPRNHSFLLQIAEVGGFDLKSLPHVVGPRVEVSRGIAPLIYHGSKRSGRLASDMISLRFSDLVHYGKRSSRFRSRADLCSAFRIDEGCKIIVTGVDHDPEIERIWGLHEHRSSVFRQIASLGVTCATTPNFSIILDVPRADNLHAMQRIGIVYNEMSEAGLPTALHINGRTDHDFVRWGEFLKDRPYIDAISYEFITGSGLMNRIQKHTFWLNSVLEAAGRPLKCIVRGNPNSLELLSDGYTPVYIETTSFVKAIKRQSCIRLGNSGLRWSRDWRTAGRDVSFALEMNSAEVARSLRLRHPSLANDI